MTNKEAEDIAYELSGILEHRGHAKFEKLPGAHPNCRPVWKQALNAAEFTGKTVKTICNTVIYAGLPLDIETHTRDEIINMPGERS